MTQVQAQPGVVPASVAGRNRLLAAIPAPERERLLPHLQLTDLRPKDLLYDVDQPIEHVYFPLDCVISTVAVLEEGFAVEVATTGLEGMAGLAAFLGAGSSPNQTFCQVPGQALRLDLDALHRFFTDDGALHGLLHRYAQAVLVYLSRNVACNRLHSADERCARWLAQTQDRVGSDSFPLIQEFLAQMLGVRRATVSLSAQDLQRAGLIRYVRGRITVLDSAGLRAAACSCYGVVRREFDRLI